MPNFDIPAVSSSGKKEETPEEMADRLAGDLELAPLADEKPAAQKETIEEMTLETPAQIAARLGQEEADRAKADILTAQIKNGDISANYSPIKLETSKYGFIQSEGAKDFLDSPYERTSFIDAPPITEETNNFIRQVELNIQNLLLNGLNNIYVKPEDIDKELLRETSINGRKPESINSYSVDFPDTDQKHMLNSFFGRMKNAIQSLSAFEGHPQSYSNSSFIHTSIQDMASLDNPFLLKVFKRGLDMIFRTDEALAKKAMYGPDESRKLDEKITEMEQSMDLKTRLNNLASSQAAVSLEEMEDEPGVESVRVRLSGKGTGYLNVFQIGSSGASYLVNSESPRVSGSWSMTWPGPELTPDALRDGFDRLTFAPGDKGKNKIITVVTKEPIQSRFGQSMVTLSNDGGINILDQLEAAGVVEAQQAAI